VDDQEIIVSTPGLLTIM